MQRVALAGAMGALVFGTSMAGGASAPPSPWDGENPFSCVLQQAGFGSTVKDPGADPFCIEFDKTHQNVTELGVVDFVSKEPARVALASDKCFYFQSDHWRGSVVQSDGSTKTYEWDGHYYFDKATGDGGAWVTNFNVNGQTQDPSTIPGMPASYAGHFGPGTGGVITHNQVQADPACIAKAALKSPYRPPPPAGRPASCRAPRGDVSAGHLGPVTLGMAESKVWAELGTPARVHRGFLRFCLRGGSKFMVGVAGDRSGLSGGPGQQPAIFLLTTHRSLKLRGVGRGATSGALRRAFPGARTWFVMGHTHVLRLGGGLLAGVKDGRIRLLAVYDTAQVRGRASVHDWLRRSA
jgi:hypothetical protein